MSSSHTVCIGTTQVFEKMIIDAARGQSDESHRIVDILVAFGLRQVNNEGFIQLH